MITFKEAIGKPATNNDGYSDADEEQTDIDIILLTGSKDEDPELVVGHFLKTAKKLKQTAHKVVVGEAWVADYDMELHTMKIMNFEGTGKSLNVQCDRTVVIVRAGAFMGEASEIGKALLQSFQESGCFMVNDLNSVVVCDNKFSAYITFSRNNVPIPKTALIPTDKALDNAHKRVGGKFPVVIKTLSGTQGIGVSIVNDMQSMTSVIQSLRKFNADLLIQEYLELEFDVRTLVLGGRILASTRRNRVKGDFRSNAHLGATTEPYELSDKEQEIIKQAARAVGGILIGVDHCIIDGKISILECNGSPGVAANYHNYDVTTVPQKLKKIGNNDNIFETIIEYLRFPSNRTLSSFTECGWMEQITIKGCGTFVAKMDTGNGSASSLKKVDKLEVKDKAVKWELNGHKYVNKLIDWSHPMLADAERAKARPIIFVEIEFNNKTYKNVPIGLATKAISDFLASRDLMTLFKVSVNSNRRFVLSDWKPHTEAT
tara:strand:- start:758 stop:2221 length:1464 start_codon:yes stop_codon:yes gene_type:complete